VAYAGDNLTAYIANTVQEGLGITLDDAEIAALEGYIQAGESTVYSSCNIDVTPWWHKHQPC